MQAGRRIEIRQVVEVRGCPEQSEQQPIHVVAALRQMAARIREREVAANREALRQMVRGVEPRGGAIEKVVWADEHAFVVVVVAGEIKRRALISAGHAERVIDNVSCIERFVRVIEAFSDGGTPTARYGRGSAALALTILPLQGIDLGYFVIRPGA